ncbi:MAG: glycosyltransferase family 39 protein [Planctomycetaceae bacterium]|jgi:hypothetical protein|nr:glycosyltransferase family 39 protein [Planctomycetaceae bacterium]
MESEKLQMESETYKRNDYCCGYNALAVLSIFRSPLSIIFLLLILSAGTLRFYNLGTWSFGYDELFTILETKVFFGETPVPDEYLCGGTVKPEDTQYYRLPRLLFASYTVHWLGYQLFGEDEFGSRFLMAILGTLNVGVIFLLAQPLIGFAGALILALLVMLLPEHILHSQCNRFYIQSFLLVSVVILLGAKVAVRRSLTAVFWLGVFAIVMVLSNSLSGIIWGGVVIGICVQIGSTLNSNQTLFSGKEGKIILVLTAWSVVLLGIFVFHIVPLAVSWNDSSSWGYTPLHAAMAFVNMLGWSLFLFAILGAGVALLNLQGYGNCYWLTLVMVSGVSVFLLPLKIIYNPFYGFLFIFPFLITASIFIREIYLFLLQPIVSDVRAKFHLRFILAVFWVIIAIFMNFPSFISYYQDGNRPDHRAAFQYVAEHWEDGDCLTGFLMGTAQYYIPDKTPRIPLRTENTAERLQTILDQEIDGNNRLWIVLHSSRGGLDHQLRQWLSEHAIFKKIITKKRFDYAENNVEIFLVHKKTSRK